MGTSSRLTGQSWLRPVHLLSLLLLTVLLSAMTPFGVAAQQDPNAPRITSLTLDNPSAACSLGDGERISGTVQSENLADTTAVVITASFGIGGFFVEWGQGTSIPGVPADQQGQYTSSQPIPENGAWAFGRNAVDDRTRAGSAFREDATTFIVQADLYDAVNGRIPRVDESTGAEFPWQVVEVDLTQCTDAPPPPVNPGPVAPPPGEAPAQGRQAPAEAQRGQSLPGGPTPPEQMPTPPGSGPQPVAPPANGTGPTQGEQLPAEEQQGQQPT